MKTLYLLRHADTVPADPTRVSDHERALSPQGNADALAVGRYMRMYALYPDLVLNSSAVRTTQTAQLVLKELANGNVSKIPARSDSELYQASPAKIISEIHAVAPSVQRLLVVGHNPGIADLAFTLGKIRHYTPGTLAVFTAECPDWTGFSAGLAQLEKVFVPKG